MSILDQFNDISLTHDQESALKKLQEFLESKDNVFTLKGYAGSGKTTLIKGLSQYIKSIDLTVELLAPTGRAAKVLSEKTEREASTIHKGIYSFKEIEEIDKDESKEFQDASTKSFKFYYKLKDTDEIINTVFIVDESSMVSDRLSEGEFFRFGSGHLLSDFLEYSRIKESDLNNKIIFVGDPAQLPPVGMNFSPALNIEYLQSKGLIVQESTLKEVKRNTEGSAILGSASKIRKCLTSGYFNDFDLRENGVDILNPDLADFSKVYSSINNQKIIITYKNKTSLNLNLQIRKEKFGAHEPIQKGDQILIGLNNYEMGILNGDFGVIVRADKTVEKRVVAMRDISPVTLKWRKVEIIFPSNTSNDRVVEGLILENYLYAESTLTPDEMRALYVDFIKRHPNLKPGTEEFRMAIKIDPYFRSIMLKFGYAVTCHKAQGGEWEDVFVVWDRGGGVNEELDSINNSNEMKGRTNSDFFRWSYTAITRASKVLRNLEPPYFNSYSRMTFISPVVKSSMDQKGPGKIENIEITMDNDAMRDLEKFFLIDKPNEIKDHFLKIRYLVGLDGGKINSYESKRYEIWYKLTRENQNAGLKYWFNSKFQFKENFQNIPKWTNSDNWYSQVSERVKELPHVVLIREVTNNQDSKSSIDWSIEEKYPFLKVLYDDLNRRFRKKNIVIEKLDHMGFRERYFVSRNSEKSVFDVEYDMKGFFGRVLPLGKKTNSPTILKELEEVFIDIRSQ